MTLLVLVLSALALPQSVMPLPLTNSHYTTAGPCPFDGPVKHATSVEACLTFLGRDKDGDVCWLDARTNLWGIGIGHTPQDCADILMPIPLEYRANDQYIDIVQKFLRVFEHVEIPARATVKLRPWQIRQWLGLDDKGKPKQVNLPPSLQTRQRIRQAMRVISWKKVTEQFGPEPRRARRKIALKWATRAFREHRKAA